MPDFSMTVSGAGVSLQTWLDPTSTPTRLNPKPEHLHKFVRVVRTTGAPKFSITDDVLGLEPADAALGGVLWVWSWVEQHNRDIVGDLPIPLGAKSSIVQFVAGDFDFGATDSPGHYLLMATRDGHGAIAIPFLVTP